MGRKRKLPPPDWRQVLEACRRSKAGRAREGDMELCTHAWKFDRERYRAVSKEGQDEAVRAFTAPFAPPEEEE